VPLATEAPVKIDRNVKDAARSVNDFALDIYARLKKKEGNIFLSPASISTALAMTYAGARGETAAEMKKTLHFTLSDKDLHPAMGKLTRLLTQKQKGCSVSIANALWGQRGYGFLKEFLNLNKQNYGAGLNHVDFERATEEARKTINAWVEQETSNKIKELIKPGILDPLTRLVLTNAIYFKGTWKEPFLKSRTRKENFHISKERSVKVDMMCMLEQKFKYMRTDDFQALELPYKGENISMVIFLPDKVDGLADFEKNLTGENLKKWMSQMSRQEIDVLAIPRFAMTCEFSLADILKEMGMPSAFALETADFSGMTGRRDLFISAVVHKTFVDVNEKGTEATAVTKRIMFGVRADHPFLFLIRDNRTGAILFMGRLANPES
jgi:serpin B